MASPSGDESTRGQDERKQAESSAQTALSFPPTIKYIIGNEFCERFSYYGMRAILALYLSNQLHLSEGEATECVHLFIVAAYLTPLLGAFISDSYWGKYKTILSLSLVYCAGNWLLSFSATLSSITIAFRVASLGLLLLALGSGGIKPCVSAFGGDQVELTLPAGSGRDHLVRSFFSYFYFSINVGSTLSTIITPLLRKDISFAVAFGLPAILMIIATLIFWSGRSAYRHRPPSGNVVAEVIRVILSAMFPPKIGGGRKRDIPEATEPLAEVEEARSVSEQDERQALLQEGEVSSSSGSNGQISPQGCELKAHWLDAAKRSHSEEKVEDIKQLLRVSLLFLPVPIFWSLFDQQASRWVFQAEKLNGSTPFGRILADQMQTLNSVLILVMIPLFDHGIYPACERMGLSIAPIRRMALGMTLGALAFLVSGLLQMQMDAHCPSAVPDGRGALAASYYVPAASIVNSTTTDDASHIAAAAGTSLSMLPRMLLGASAKGDPQCFSILWQVPQYVIMTAGEILFSITGLELAFSQAPDSMKSVVSALWCITVAFGNLFTVIVVGSIGPLLTRTQEFFFFAALCMLSVFLFLWVGSSYNYVERVSDEVAMDEGALAVDQPLPLMEHHSASHQA